MSNIPPMVKHATPPQLPGSALQQPAGLPGTQKAGIVEKQSIPNRDILLNFLSHGEGRITDLLTIARGKLASMREDEQSYFNFINAENTLGLSNLWLDRPASSFRYDAARNYVSALEDIRFSINTVRAHIENGSLPMSKPAIRKFFDGPVGRIVDWNQLLKSPDGNIPPHLLYPNDDALAVGLVSLANRFDSDEMAILTAKSFKSLIGDDAYKNMLPDSSVVFWNDYGRDIANSTVSLPQLAGYASGAALGMAVSRSAQAMVASSTALKVLGRGRYLLPGVNLLQATVATSWKSHWLTRGICNLGFNLTKFQTYATIGYFLGGRTGLEIAGATFMGGLGISAGLTQGWLQKMAAELSTRDVSATLGQWLLKDKLDKYARVSLSVEIPAVDNANSFKLVTAKHARSTYEAMTAFQDELVKVEQTEIHAAEQTARRALEEQHRLAAITQRAAVKAAKAAERAAKQQLRISAQLQKLLVEAYQFSTALPEMQAQRLMQDVHAAVSNPLSCETTATIQSLIQNAKLAQIAAASARTPRAMKAVTPQGQSSVIKPGTRAERLATHIPARGLPKSIAQLIDTPPATLGDLLDSMHTNMFNIDASCRPALARLYEDSTPAVRKLIILRISEMDGASPQFGTQWKALEGTEGRLWNGNIGLDHEIMVRHNGGGFLDGPPWTIVSLSRKTTKSAARARTPQSMPRVLP